MRRRRIPPKARLRSEPGRTPTSGEFYFGINTPSRFLQKTVLTADDDAEKRTNEIGAFIRAMDLVPDIAGRTVTAGAEAILQFNRVHWSRERVHRILDDAVTWNEDGCRIRSGHGPENLSCLRRLAIGLVLGRGKPVAPTIGELNRNPRLVLDWLRLSRNTQPRTKSAA